MPPCLPQNDNTHSRGLRVRVGNLRVVAAVEGADAVGVTAAVVHSEGGVEAAAARPGDDDAVGGGGVLVELRGKSQGRRCE